MIDWLWRYGRQKVGVESTPESLLVLLIRFVGRIVGAEDNGTIGKGIESSVFFSDHLAVVPVVP